MPQVNKGNESVKTKKTNRRKKEPKKPLKIGQLIMTAIKNLRKSKGTSANKIAGYLSYTTNLPDDKVKRQVKTALKRSVEYGILRRYRGKYYLASGDELDELDRADKIAERFASLPTPAASKIEISGEGIESSGTLNQTKSRKSLNSLGKMSRGLQSNSGTVSMASIPELS